MIKDAKASIVKSGLIILLFLFFLAIANAQTDLDTDQVLCDTAGFDWGGNLQNPSGRNELCCGDDSAEDEGKVLQAVTGPREICNNDGNEWEWIPANVQHHGSVLKISNSDNYEVLATNGGRWMACDSDASLAPIYKDSEFTQSCTGISAKCTAFNSNEFLCGNYEEIDECILDRELKTGDEKSALNFGEFTPNPFTKNFSEFNRAVLGICGSDVCIDFPREQEISTSNPRLRDWSGYNKLVFEIFFNTVMDSDKLSVEIAGSGGGSGGRISSPLSNYFISKKESSSGVWYRVAIQGIPSQITLFRLVPNSSMSPIEINNVHLEGSSSAYCGKITSPLQSKWKQDLDDDEMGCDAQNSASWSGNKCCGDDLTAANVALQTSYRGEFFNDDDLCYNSELFDGEIFTITVPVSSSGPGSSNQSPRLLFFDNQLYGCSLTGGYSWASQLRSTTDSGGAGSALVQSSNLCAGFTDNITGYFCDTNGWSVQGYLVGSVQVDASERISLRNSPSGNSSSCCRQNDCWSGSTCVPRGDVSYLLQASGGRQYYVCNNGTWSQTSQQFDWLFDESGFCEDNSQCLLETDPLVGVSVSQDQNISKCKPSGWYSKLVSIPGISKNYSNDVNDLYCESGQWTSRTSFIAQKMLQMPRNDFTLVCGEHNRVLVQGSYLDFVVPGGSSGEFTNAIDKNIFNNLCILKYDDSVVVGSSSNEFGLSSSAPFHTDFENSVVQAFNVEIDLSTCLGSADKYQFRRCDSSSGWFYYNSLTQSFIYSPTNDALRQGIVIRLYDLFITPILQLFGVIQRGPLEVSSEPLRFSSLFNYLYYSQAGTKEILAVGEAKKSEALHVHEQISASFINFDENICETADVWDENHPRRGRETIVCTSDGNRQTIFTIIGSSNPYQEITSMDFIDELIMNARLK